LSLHLAQIKPEAKFKLDVVQTEFKSASFLADLRLAERTRRSGRGVNIDKLFHDSSKVPKRSERQETPAYNHESACSVFVA